ncbi:uncharacterized protein LOC128228387 isoform X2 [Mya arenaria]|uniref:uncharacterized protein LOC128228387 isoform X2 n=1 Tax=Mya arenaria TaxID=6604 RepID=UPI0022E415DF|nr:uncharacterized protein LOC128228387 isoform X2 [Mya arenaria]
MVEKSMQEGVDRWTATPRSTTPGRPLSVRTSFRPAIHDLSEQAARNSTGPPDDGILSVVSTCTPRVARSADSHGFPDKFQSPTPLLGQFSPEEAIRASPTSKLCFKSHNTEYLEDLHRQRVLVSAHHRRKLHSRLRRSRSTPVGGGRSGSQSRAVASDLSRHSSDDDSDKLDFTITNGQRLDEEEFKERINYRLINRTKPKVAYSHATLMPNGAPLSQVNGYQQTLVQNFPQYSQKYCSWLTRGFKVQSFHTNNRAVPDYNHARPPPPLVQYINRTKTVSATSRWPNRQSRAAGSINVVGFNKPQHQTLEFPGGRKVVVHTGEYRKP